MTCNVPALAQERLFVFDNYSNTLAELGTEESNFGVVRQQIHLPLGSLGAGFTPNSALAGGRFLILRGTVGVAIFDTRTFTILRMPQWAALPTLAFDADALRSRIFYRTKSEFGVMEGPLFVPRVLGATGDPGLFEGTLKYVARTNMLLVTRHLTYTEAHIVAFDADTDALRGAIILGGLLHHGPLLVDAQAHRLHVP